MNWKQRAWALRTLAVLPGGGAIYQVLQNRFGGFRNDDFVRRRFRRQRELAGAIVDQGKSLDGAHLVEVGTGWVPLLPLGFWICGAARVETYDLNSYLSWSLTRHCLRWMGHHRDELLDAWSDLAPRDEVRRKLQQVERLQDRPRELFEEARIRCHAPADAATTGLADGSIDIHYSANVFEHIPLEVLRDILREAHRLLRPDGLAVHHADPSDHFAHTDPAISRINFLRLTEDEWRRYYGNRFSYLNRLHDSDYSQLFAEASLRLLDTRFDHDPRILEQLEAGFPLASPFCDKSADDLCRCNMTYVASVQGVS